jgi:hypothetical protein
MLPRERRLPTEELKEAEKLVAVQVNKLIRYKNSIFYQ